MWQVVGAPPPRVHRFGRAAGAAVNPAVLLRHAADGSECVVCAASAPDGGVLPVVMDAADHDVDAAALFVQTNGYVYRHVGATCATHHSLVMAAAARAPPAPDMSIDHVNWHKTDNRRANLRVVDHAEQQRNRADRADRQMPPAEVRDLVSCRLPRGVRWDACESKFVVDLPGSAQLTGTKSAAVSTANKLRDCLQKLQAHLEAGGGRATSGAAVLAEQRVRLGNEHNAIVRAAHAAHPERIPDGPYVDVEALGDELACCRAALAHLPAPQEGEALRGAQRVAKGVVPMPHAGAIALVKGGAVLLFDAAHEAAVRRLPEVDTSGGAPVLVARPLLAQFPEFDAGGARKVTVKEFVWRALLRRELPDGHCVMPLNHQASDLRAANLVLLPGSGKEHKGPEGVPFVPEEHAAAAGMRFLPRGVTLSRTAGQSKVSPWMLYYRSAATGKRTSFACGPINFPRVFLEGLLPLVRNENPAFDEANESFQRLLGEYLDARGRVQLTADGAERA